MIKAVGLFSGGLDSILAIKLVSGQGIDVHAVHFTGPFFSKKQLNTAEQKKRAEAIGAKYIELPITKDYYQILRHPKHGRGRGINCCIDCHIYMFRKAKQYARKIGAKFVFTGEVLDERPMSQYQKALEIIETEAGLKGKLLRPLSAKLLTSTEAEKKGWIDREKLLDFRGRERKKQIALAKHYGIADYPSPAGGCLLTEKEFAGRVIDYLKFNKKITDADFELLKTGRHFRYIDNKIIVGRSLSENQLILNLKRKNEYIFHIPELPSPITLLQGKKTKEAVILAAKLTAKYSDIKEEPITINYGLHLEKKIAVSKVSQEETIRLRI